MAPVLDLSSEEAVATRGAWWDGPRCARFPRYL